MSTRRPVVGRRPPLRRRREPAHDRPTLELERDVPSSGSAAAAARCQARRSGSASRVRRLGEGSVDETSVADRRFLVDDGTHEGMTEPAAASRFRAGLRSSQGWPPRPVSRSCGGLEDQGWVTGRLGGRHQQQALRSGQESELAAGGSSLRPGRDGDAIRQPETARECRGRPSARHSSNASGLPPASARIRSRTDSSIGPLIAEARTVRACGIAQGPRPELRESRKSEGQRARAKRRGSRRTPRRTGGRRNRGPGRTPGRATAHRPPGRPAARFGDIREQAEHGEPHEKSIRRGAPREAERCA